MIGTDYRSRTGYTLIGILPPALLHRQQSRKETYDERGTPSGRSYRLMRRAERFTAA